MSLPILITGGSQRLGLAIAQDLLANDQPVIITYRRHKPSVDALKKAGAIVLEADFSTQAGISRAIEQIKRTAPKLRGIIHNASDWVPENPESAPGDLMHNMMMVHSNAPYQLNLALKAALQSDDGTLTDIIHMTDYVQETGSENHIAYAASKAALHNLTLSFARVYAPQVKVNSIAPSLENGLSDEAKRQRIEHAMRDVMETLGLDLSDDSLSETPERIAKMYVDEIFSGLDYRKFPKITQIENKMQVGQPVQVSDISLTSTCEHHFVTIDGTATVAYIPKDTVIGLSKINRLVGFFAQRPQVQERLTQQVLVALQALTGTEDVAVVINATHYCVKARGIRDSLSYTKTSALGGQFLADTQLRREFFGG